MPPTRKALALSIGLASVLSVASLAPGQAPRPAPAGAADSQLVIDDATVDFLQKSDISALREGVIDRMELRIGKEVGRRGDVIGYLVKDAAVLAADEARIQSEGQGGKLKAEAQKLLAKNVVQRNNALLKKGPQYVSPEEFQKGEAEFAIADASVIEAVDMLKLAAAKLKSAERIVEEHIIRAPFPGVIIEEFKHEGESVRANEPVVRLGNLDTVRVWAYIPIEYAYRVTPGTEMVIQPRLGGTRIGKHAIEQKQFRGVISFVDLSIQPVAESAVRVYADLDNASHELKPGLKATMTIFLKPEAATAGASQPNAGARQASLPPLPR